MHCVVVSRCLACCVSCCCAVSLCVVLLCLVCRVVPLSVLFLISSWPLLFRSSGINVVQRLCVQSRRSCSCAVSLCIVLLCIVCRVVMLFRFASYSSYRRTHCCSAHKAMPFPLRSALWENTRRCLEGPPEGSHTGRMQCALCCRFKVPCVLCLMWLSSV